MALTLSFAFTYLKIELILVALICFLYAPVSVKASSPTLVPTVEPTLAPTAAGVNPTYRPTPAPRDPTPAPSRSPTRDPVANPTFAPRTGAPTLKPTYAPTQKPTSGTQSPTRPTALPTIAAPVASQAPTAVQDSPVDTTIFYQRSRNCPKACSGKGLCDGRFCKCFYGYHGVDCSLRVCPSGTAWVDMPYANNLAHANYTECSNMGTCDRRTGQCICNKGYSGAACESMLCPVGTAANNVFAPCNGNGRCVSLLDRSTMSSVSKSLLVSTYNGWEAQKVYGCVCDEGWQGVACNQRACPYGVDAVRFGVREVHLIDCTMTSGSGSFILSYAGASTQPLPHTATAELIAWRLEAISTIQSVEVTILQGSTLCSAGGSVTSVTFILPQKPSFPLFATAYGPFTGVLSVKMKGSPSALNSAFLSVVGTKDFVECSNRGICDKSTGICQCFSGFTSSNGLGESGPIPDCGYNALGGAVACPTYNGVTCGGRGTCLSATKTCQCNEGYGGGDCSLVLCLAVSSWFGEIYWNGTQRVGAAPCSGVGDCNYATGKCLTCGGSTSAFTGQTCSQLSCLQTGIDRGLPSYCNQNGACLSLRKMAPLALNDFGELVKRSYTEPWDADMVQGCACFRLESVDNQYDPGYRNPENTTLIIDGSVGTLNFYPELNTLEDGVFYRGPFALTATRFLGVNCNEFGCPTGDNPDTVGVDEIQALRCIADSGYFRLTFRDNVTMPIAANATAPVLMYLLQQLYTIHRVEVQINGIVNNPIAICSSYDDRITYVRFVSEFGDLPTMTADITYLKNSLYLPFVYIHEHQKGTKEEQECSGQGVCSSITGICSCSPGYGSSNGSIFHPGQTGDCSYYSAADTALFSLDDQYVD